VTQVDLNAAAPAIGGVFALGAVGYVAVRARVLTRIGVAELTRLLVSFILPAFLFESVYNEFSREKLPFLAVIGGLELAAVVLGASLAWALAAVVRARSHRGTIMALCAYQNNAYLPVPLVMALLAPDDAARARFFIGIFVLFFNPLLWTVGAFLLGEEVPRGRRLATFLRRMANGPFLSVLAGILVKTLFLQMGWTMPHGVLVFVKTLGGATVPLAMVVLGAILAEAHWSRDFEPRAIFVVMAVKMALVPLVALAWLRTVPALDPILKLVVLVEAAAPPATNIMLVTKRYGGNTSLVALVLFATYLVSILTMPLWLRLL
jgi:hypothetical protein